MKETSTFGLILFNVCESLGLLHYYKLKTNISNPRVKRKWEILNLWIKLNLTRLCEKYLDITVFN